MWVALKRQRDTHHNLQSYNSPNSCDAVVACTCEQVLEALSRTPSYGVHVVNAVSIRIFGDEPVSRIFGRDIRFLQRISVKGR